MLGLHRRAQELQPGLLCSAVVADDLGDGRLRYRIQKVVGYDRKGRPIYQIKGSSRQTWQESLIVAEVDGTALTGTAAGTVLPPAARFTLPANFMDVGKVLRVTAKGRISNIITTPGTLTLDIRMGPTSNIVVFNGGAMQLNAVAKTNVTWIFDAMLTCRTIGNGTVATLFGIGQWTSESVVGSPLPSVGGSGTLLAPASAPAAGTGFDSTVAMVADMFGTFSLTGNSLTAHEYLLEALN